MMARYRPRATGRGRLSLPATGRLFSSAQIARENSRNVDFLLLLPRTEWTQLKIITIRNRYEKIWLLVQLVPLCSCEFQLLAYFSLFSVNMDFMLDPHSLCRSRCSVISERELDPVGVVKRVQIGSVVSSKPRPWWLPAFRNIINFSQQWYSTSGLSYAKKITSIFGILFIYYIKMY